MTTNKIEYFESGNSCWQHPMPTWLIDGQDLAELLKVTGLADNRVSGIGVDPSHPFIYPEPSIFNKVPVNTSSRQLVLWIDFGDVVGSFSTVLVHAEDEFIHWSKFDSLEGARTQLAPCGPFSFVREEYARVMHGIVVPAYALLKKYQMYSHLTKSSFDLLW